MRVRCCVFDYFLTLQLSVWILLGHCEFADNNIFWNLWVKWIRRLLEIFWTQLNYIFHFIFFSIKNRELNSYNILYFLTQKLNIIFLLQICFYFFNQKKLSVINLSYLYIKKLVWIFYCYFCIKKLCLIKNRKQGFKKII